MTLNASCWTDFDADSEAAGAAMSQVDMNQSVRRLCTAGDWSGDTPDLIGGLALSPSLCLLL